VTHQSLVLVDDTLKFTGTTGASMNILANDRDPDGDSLSILAVRGNPKWGRIETNANGTVTYYPNQTLTPSAADPDGHIRDNVLIDVTDGHGDTGTEKFNVDFIYGDYTVNLPDVKVSPALIPGPYRNPGPAPGAPIPLVLSNPDGHVELQGHLVHNQSVAYKFHVPPFYTLFLDYRQEAQFEDPNAPNYLQYVASPNTTPWLRAFTDNIHPVFTVDQGFGGGHILNLSNLGGAYLGHTPGARWYEDPLMPGDYYFTITNTEFDSPAGSQEWPVLTYNIYAWLGPDDAGNNAYWARDLGTISGAANPNPPNDPNFIDRTKSYVEYVSRVDDKDYYSFTLTKPSAVSIALVTQTSTFGNNVHLYEDDIDSSAVMGLTHYLIPSAQQYRDIQTTAGRDTPLAAGTYFFSVEKPSGHSYDLNADYTDGVQQSEEDRQNYKVFVTVWDDNANHTAANATDLGLINNTTLTRSDNVSIANPNDWYKFHVSSASTFNLSVAPTNRAFTVGIEFARFNPIDLSILPATNSYIVFANSGADGNALALGPYVQLDPNVTYWVRVFEKKTYPLLDNITYDNPFAYPDDGNTDYNLSIQTTTIPPGSAPDITGDPGPNLLIGANGPVISGASRIIRGMGGGDTVYTGPGNNTVVGGPGNNNYTAGSGFNTLDYSGSPNGTTINLRNGMAQNGYGGTDTISSFKAFAGSASNDAFLIGPGNVSIDGRGGTDTVAFTGQYANYTISYSATTKADTITDLRSASPDGTNTVTNVEILQFADGTANLDSAGRLASAIINKSDGSRTAYAWDTQNQYNWSDYTISTDAQGRTTTQTTDYDNGTRSLEVWDVLNKNPWVDYIYYYDSQGRTTGQTVDYHNGTRTVQAWDVLNQNTWSDYVYSYDTQGRATSQSVDYRSGIRTAQYWDVLNQNTWSDWVGYYDSQNRETTHFVDNHDGTHTAQYFDVQSQNTWTSWVGSYDSQNRETTHFVNNDDGTRTAQYFDVLNQNPWTDYVYAYDRQGRLTSQTINYRDSHHTVQVYDVSGTQTWSSVLTSYDSSWHQTSQTFVYRAPPVVLDLDGNGIDITPLSASTASFDMNGGGQRLPTAWVAGHDGLLAIDLGADGQPGPDGVIDQAKEINFTLWAPSISSDLQALREVFDTDRDGKLDPGDARWSEFRVWADANWDGVSQPGEQKTLSDLGIASIDLNPSPSSKSFSDGSSIQGLSSFVRSDGSTALVGDAVFAYASTRSADLSALALGANSSTTIPAAGDGAHSPNLALLGSYMASTFAGAGGDYGGAPIADASLMAAQTAITAHPHA